MQLLVEGEFALPCRLPYLPVFSLPLFYGYLSGRYEVDGVLWETSDGDALLVGHDAVQDEVEVEVFESVLFAVGGEVFDVCWGSCRKNRAAAALRTHGSLM